MTIVVSYKYAANPQDAAVAPDGTVDWSRTKAGISEYDPVAIQLARNVADENGAELVGISVGTSTGATSMAKKAVMSRGLDRGLVLADDAVAGWNHTRVAEALSGLVKRIDGVNLVITGDSSIDEGARMMSAIIAGFLGWPCFQEVTEISGMDDGSFRITQVVQGETRTIDVRGPLVVAATSDAVTAKVPSMKEILAAGRKPVEVVTTSDIATGEIGVEVLGRSRPEPAARKNKVFKGDDAAVQLVAALRADGVL